MQKSLPKRYCSNVSGPPMKELERMVKQLESHAELSKTTRITKIEDQRKMHRSCAQMHNKKKLHSTNFNNKTKQGEYFTRNPPQIPYLFIPKYKNETFIMPDRVFEKGDAGKRFFIKMKDTSILSFKEEETQRYKQVTMKKEKDQTITSRKFQELNRILDTNDGKIRCSKNKWFLKNRKIFNPTSSGVELFTATQPMLSPKDAQNIQIKKTTLSKTHATNKWRPVSTTTQIFNKTFQTAPITQIYPASQR